MNDIIKEKDSRKKVIAKVAAIFLVIMVLLTFFSNTINNFSLPRVKTVQPVSNCLVKEVTASGTVQARKNTNIYCQASRMVQDVYVKTGDRVKTGDPLFLLDITDLEENLKEETILLEKAKLLLQKLINSNVEEDSSDNKKKASIKEAQEKISDAKEALKDANDQYDSGILSGSELSKVQKELALAERDYEEKLEDYNTGIEENLEKTEKLKKELKENIEEKQLDFQLQQLKVDMLKKELALGNRVNAPCDGIVKEVSIEKGSMTNPNSVVCSIVDTSRGFEFVAAIDNDSIRQLSIGDQANIVLEASNGKTIEGKLTNIRKNTKDMGTKKDLVISIPQEGLSGGEAGNMTISRKTKSYDLIVPNSSVGQDDKGTFVYVLKENKGPLGNEYHVQRVSVTVADHDYFNSAIQSGIGSDEQVIVYSSKDVLVDGCRVMPER